MFHRHGPFPLLLMHMSHTPQVKAKYSNLMSDVFRETFCWLPLAYVLNSRVIVLHGGLFSNDDVTLDDIRKINRFREPPDEGIMCELLWSDPSPVPGRTPSKRGVGVAFGEIHELHFLSHITSMCVHS